MARWVNRCTPPDFCIFADKTSAGSEVRPLIVIGSSGDPVGIRKRKRYWWMVWVDSCKPRSVTGQLRSDFCWLLAKKRQVLDKTVLL